LRSMTEGLVRQFTDFASLESYLDGYAITGPRLSSLRFPAAILLAEDDPMIPAADLGRLARSPRLTVLRTRHGGHCGFMEQLNGQSFADRSVVTQFERSPRHDTSSALSNPKDSSIEGLEAAHSAESRR